MQLMYEGKAGLGGTLNWATRIRVMLEAAQGMVHEDGKDNKKMCYHTLISSSNCSFSHM